MNLSFIFDSGMSYMNLESRYVFLRMHRHWYSSQLAFSEDLSMDGEEVHKWGSSICKTPCIENASPTKLREAIELSLPRDSTRSPRHMSSGCCFRKKLCYSSVRANRCLIHSAFSGGKRWLAQNRSPKRVKSEWGSESEGAFDHLSHFSSAFKSLPII